MPPEPPGPGSGRSNRSTAPIIVAVVLVLAVVAGGGALLLSGSDGDDGDETDASATTEPSGEQTGEDGGDDGSAAAGSAASLTGTWEGTYVCEDGEHGLTLTIDDPGNGTVGANFATHEPGEEIDDGTTRWSTEGLTTDGLLTLEPREWIVPEEPTPADVAYGLEADLQERSDSERLEGRLNGPPDEGCTTYSVERTSTDPWYVGVWEGRYGCAQGLTGLRMTIEPERDGVVEALFEFYALPENPDVPSGSFRMEGTYDEAREVSLHGVEWVEQPAGYVMVDLLFIAELGVDPERLYGAVSDDDDSCSVFTLSRPDQSGSQDD